MHETKGLKFFCFSPKTVPNITEAVVIAYRSSMQFDNSLPSLATLASVCNSESNGGLDIRFFQWYFAAYKNKMSQLYTITLS